MADGSKAIGTAVRKHWPKATFYACEFHLGRALAEAARCAGIWPADPARPPMIPIAVTRPPSRAAARAAFRPLPPGRATTSSGRWIAPAVRCSTSYSRSIEGFAATKTKRRPRLRQRRLAVNPAEPSGRSAVPRRHSGRRRRRRGASPQRRRPSCRSGPSSCRTRSWWGAPGLRPRPTRSKDARRWMPALRFGRAAIDFAGHPRRAARVVFPVHVICTTCIIGV